MKPAFVAYISATLILLYYPCSAQLMPQQQKNLTAFSRLYGYVRYFHPSDEASTLDWDGFAIYGARKMLEPKDDKELISTLWQLFHPIAPTVVIYPEKEKYTFSIASITPPDTSDYRPIAWQHLGVGISNNIYKSIRINRPDVQKERAVQSFAPLGQTFSASGIRGKEFRFSGWMKVDSTQGGAGHFWIRIHKNKEVVFFYNMGNRPATSPTWKEYSFTGRVDKDADTVVLGAFLAGKGSLLVDHIRLSVKEGGEWKDIPLENGSFEKSDSAAANGWRYNQHLAGYRYATETTDVQDGSLALSIISIQEPKRPSDKPIVQPLFGHYPRPGEYVAPDLVPGIACLVPLALYGNKEHTWPSGDTAALALLEHRIQTAHPTSVNGDSLAVRLGDVIIGWNIFRHFFPYWEDASATPDQLLEKGMAKAATDKNRYDFQQTLRLMTAPLNDGHINIFLQGDTVRQAYVPLVFAKAEGRLVIDQVLDSSLRPSLAPGDVVKTVNGLPADSYLANIDLTTSGSPQLKVFRDLGSLTVGPLDSTLTLGILRPDGIRIVRVKRNMEWKTWDHAQTRHPSGWIRPGIFFIDIDRAPMDSINAWMPQLTKAKAIVCDLRGYPNNNHELIRHLLDKDENTKWMFVPRITYPDYQSVTYNSGGWQMTPDSPRLHAQIFFLTDGSAISYAESYMGFIKDFHLATVVGQPTAGTNGNINPFVLPGGFHVNFTGMLVKDHNGGKHHLKGITPDVPTERTVKGIREGRDEFLEKAIELSEK